MILFILLSSCNEREIVNMDGVKRTEVQLTPLELENEPLFPKGCFVLDSILVLYDGKDKENFLYAYKDGQIFSKFGQRGEGADEFINPRFICKGINKSLIQIGDETGIYSLDLNALIQGTPKQELLALELPEELRLYNYLLRIDKDNIIVNQTGEKQLTFYNRHTKSAERKEYFERSSSFSNASDLCYAMQIFDAHYNAGEESIVIAYKNRKQIDLVSFDGEMIKRIYFPNYDYNIPKMHIEENNLKYDVNARLFFSFVYTEDDYFYALCQNDTRNNIKSGKCRTQIYKLDWEGNVKEVYSLDKCISYFCINDSILYAVGIDEVDLELNVFYAVIK